MNASTAAYRTTPMRWTPRWSPTTRPARPSTTTSISAAAATRTDAIHDMAWQVDLDVATQLARRASRPRRDRGDSPPAPAGGRRSSRRRASSGPTTRPPSRSTGRASGSLAHGLRAHLHVRDAWAEPDRAVDVVFAGLLAEPRPARIDCRRSSASSVAGCDRAASFLFIDSRPDPQSGAGDHDARTIGADVQLRRLADGRAFRVVKEYYEPDELAQALAIGRLRADRRSRRPAASSCSAGRRRLTPALYSRPCRPRIPRSQGSTIATVGSGVMAEAMIAGLLRGQIVEPRPGGRQPSARRPARRSSSASTASARSRATPRRPPTPT